MKKPIILEGNKNHSTFVLQSKENLRPPLICQFLNQCFIPTKVKFLDKEYQNGYVLYIFEDIATKEIIQKCWHWDFPNYWGLRYCS